MQEYVDFYSRLYSVIDNTTPMFFDCGQLCANSCCSGEGLGMLLFPGEDIYLDSFDHDFEISDSKIIFSGVPVKLLVCNGSCKRTLRPLACRIFPLFPSLRNGRLSVEFDPRAIGKCPLRYEDIEGIYTRGLFRLKVLKVGLELKSFEPTHDFLSSLTAELDEISRFKK